MSRVNSKKKGNRFELKIAKALTDFWGIEFKRTIGSGAIHNSKDHAYTRGDVTAGIGADFPFTIECKHREDWTIESFANSNKDVVDWWVQSVEDADDIDSVPILFFTRNYADDYVMLPYKENVYQALKDKEFPLIRMTLKYEQPITEDQIIYDVLTTNLDGFTSEYKAFYQKEYKGFNWQEETVITIPKEAEEPIAEEAIENILDQLT